MLCILQAASGNTSDESAPKGLIALSAAAAAAAAAAAGAVCCVRLRKAHILQPGHVNEPVVGQPMSCVVLHHALVAC
jgi:hypothetical protein